MWRTDRQTDRQTDTLKQMVWTQTDFNKPGVLLVLKIAISDVVHSIQVFAIELVTIAVDFVLLAIELGTFAIEFIPFAVQFITLALGFVTLKFGIRCLCNSICLGLIAFAQEF